MALMAGIDLELAANLLDEPKDDFQPKPLALTGLASGGQSRPVVQHRQRKAAGARFTTRTVMSPFVCFTELVISSLVINPIALASDDDISVVVPSTTMA
jgi:hypothetical protein